MNLISTHSLIHGRMKRFAKWIAPEKERKEEIDNQAEDILNRIIAKAEADGLILVFAKTTGSHVKQSSLRRYMRGSSVEEGQDIDLSYIFEPKDQDGNELGCLVYKMKEYAEACFPDSEIGETKSSATIHFSSKKLKYDLVPLFETSRKNIQLLKRTDGSERNTSVQKHVDFILDRKKTSDNIAGVVKFNECLRLLKWWRTEQQEQSGIFGNDDGDDKVPSFLLDLLGAYAYDNVSVQKTYPETLAKWFGFLANVVRNRKDVTFNNSSNSSSFPILWKVIDPVDDTNNVVGKWNNAQINELARWFEESRDLLHTAIRNDDEGNDNVSMDCLVKIFGNAFKNNCD